MRPLKELEIVLDGDRLKPATVDPFKAIPYVLAYLEALQVEAAVLGEKLTFEGFRVTKGSFKVTTSPSSLPMARRARDVVHDKLRRGDSSSVHMRRLAGSNVSNYVTKFVTRVAGKAMDLPTAVTSVVADIITEITSFRCELVGIDAKKEGSRAKFRTILDGEVLELDVDRKIESVLLRSFRGQLDVSAELRRDAITRTQKGGVLLSFHSVDDGPALPAWQEWFREAGAGWAKVAPEDIEKELGRDD